MIRLIQNAGIKRDVFLFFFFFLESHYIRKIKRSLESMYCIRGWSEVNWEQQAINAVSKASLVKLFLQQYQVYL